MKTFPTWPNFAADEIAAVEEVLASGKVNYWTGDKVKQFEKAFADYHQAAYGIAIANGTLALELALMALDIGSGDEVIVPCRTFMATASAVVIRGATPIIVDVDYTTQNITAKTLAPHIGPKTKAIIAVHLAGMPCEMDAILDVAKQHNLYVIEDCAQAHGAIYNGRLVGSMGDVAAFSFCQDKIMTTGGEGGMVLTQNEALFKKMWTFKDHGKNYEKVFNMQHPPGFRWLHDSFGSNYRMTEMQAAIGLKQLEKLPAWLVKRQQLARRFNQNLKDIAGITIFEPAENIQHSYYKYYFTVDNQKISRDVLLQQLMQQQIPAYSGSCPDISLEKAFENQQKIAHPQAKQLGEESIMLLVHPTLTFEHVDYVSEQLRVLCKQKCNV